MRCFFPFTQYIYRQEICGIHPKKRTTSYLLVKNYAQMYIQCFLIIENMIWLERQGKNISYKGHSLPTIDTDSEIYTLIALLTSKLRVAISLQFCTNLSIKYLHQNLTRFSTVTTNLHTRNMLADDIKLTQDKKLIIL